MRRRDFLETAGAAGLGFVVVEGLIEGVSALRDRGVQVTEATPGQQAQVTGDLVDLFTRHLRLCKVKEGETVLFYTGTSYARPEYLGATLAGAKALGASAFVLTSAEGSDQSGLLSEAFKAADIVYGAIPLYTDAHNEALASGTRTLMVTEGVESLQRMFPHEGVIRRTYAGAARMEQAREIRVTDDQGTDLRLMKTGRKGHAQVGLSPEPGRWDHWPSGLVACGPLEDQTEGVYIVNPGDIILGLRIRCTQPVRITLAAGRVTKIEGGTDADMIRQRLELFQNRPDPQGRLSDPFRIAHAGWGTEHRAQWQNMGMDSESMYGNVMISLGRNMFDSKDRFAGLGGKNYTPVHIDICMRNKKLYLDGDLIVENNRIVVPELA